MSIFTVVGARDPHTTRPLSIIFTNKKTMRKLDWIWLTPDVIKTENKIIIPTVYNCSGLGDDKGVIMIEVAMRMPRRLPAKPYKIRRSWPVITEVRTW